jgi:hypothetical protein
MSILPLDHVSLLQDEDDNPYHALNAAIPLDAEYGDMLQPPKPDAD